jgi:hypothetical protein
MASLLSVDEIRIGEGDLNRLATREAVQGVKGKMDVRGGAAGMALEAENDLVLSFYG